MNGPELERLLRLAILTALLLVVLLVLADIAGVIVRT